ncbi:MAG: oligosaccharide flippase family protein [Christensenellales bacterium]
MKKSFLSGAGVLALSVIFAKVLGAAYRIPLANILGTEGMGLYQFVYPVFALLLTLSSGAMPTAVSITVSKYLARGDEEGAKRAFNVILRLCVIIGTAGSLLLVGLAYPLSLLQSREAFLGYIAIAPAVLIVSVISAFRGYFMGRKNMVPSSISQITEGIVKLGVGIGLSLALLPYGLTYAVVGALGGVVASEAVTLIVMLGIFVGTEKRFEKIKLSDNRELIGETAKLVSPLIICGMILPLSQFLDSVLIVNLLRGVSLEATSLYGIFSGAVSPLINLPVMVCITLGIAITPQMVEGRVKRDVDFIMDKCNTATKLTFMLGIPFVFIFVFMSEGVVRLLFPTLSADKLYLAGTLLKISAISVLGLSLFQIYSAMLQGLNKTKVPVYIMGICVAVKTAIYSAITPFIGIVGVAIGSAAGYSLAGVVIMGYFYRYVRKSDNLIKNVSLITLCGVIMGFVIFMSERLLTSRLSVVIVGAVAAAVYAIALFTLRVFSVEELDSMPLGKYLVAIDKKIHN